MVSAHEREIAIEKAREHWKKMRPTPRDIHLEKSDMLGLFRNAFFAYLHAEDESTKTAAAGLAVVAKTLIEGKTIVVTPNPNNNSRILWEKTTPSSLDKIIALQEEEIAGLRECLMSPITNPETRSHKARELRDQFRKPQTINIMAI